jgi:hypothetical protein
LQDPYRHPLLYQLKKLGVPADPFFQLRYINMCARPSAASEMIAQYVPRHMIHPGLELALAGEGVPGFQHPVKHGLNHIFSGFPLPAHIKKETIQGPVVSLKQQGHLIQVPGFDF